MSRALLLLAPALSVSLGACARPAPLPPGRLSFLSVGKTGTGRLANDIGLGYGLGFEAQYAPLPASDRIGWGASWSTQWTRYDDGARISSPLNLVELDLGLRGRVALGARQRAFLWLGGGGALLRSSEPILDGERRAYAGPWGGAGLEGRINFWWGLRPIVGIGARYGLIADGQGTLGVLLSIGGGA